MEPRMESSNRNNISPNTFSNSEITTSKKTEDPSKTPDPLKTPDLQEKVISIFSDLAQQPRETLRPLPSMSDNSPPQIPLPATPDSSPPQTPIPPTPRGMQPRRALPPTPGSSSRVQGQASGPPQISLPATPDSLPPQSPIPPIPQGMQPRRALPPTPRSSSRVQGQASGPPQIPLPATPDSSPPQTPLPPPPSGIPPARPSTPPPGTSIHAQKQVSAPPQSALPPVTSDAPPKRFTKSFKFGEVIQDRLQNFAAKARYHKASKHSDISKEKVEIQGNSVTLSVNAPAPPVRHPDLPFSQDNVISEVTGSSKDYKELSKINARFNGLCEIICNKILIEDLLGEENLKDLVTAETLTPKQTKDELAKNESSNDKTENTNLAKTHLVNVMPVFNVALSLISKYYPDNIFSYKEQSKLVTTTSHTPLTRYDTNYRCTLNSEVAKEKLQNLPDGEVLKVIVFKKKGVEFSGHSLLLKKVAKDNYTFFDPDFGEFKDLTYEQLKIEIDRQFLLNDGTDILFMKGSDYLKRLGIEPK